MYSTKRISSQLIEEIKTALQSVNFGSIEIYISDNSVTQITTRTIKKTSIKVKAKEAKKQTDNASGNKKNKDTKADQTFRTNILSLSQH